jgi:dienelactone hydrolase
MTTPDLSLPIDARLYRFRNIQSVFPLPEWGSLAQWKKKREEIRQHLWLTTGLNDRTSAFKARGRVIKTFEHEGIVIENIRVEALPGLYVMGNLYRPKNPGGKLPLVLHPHGHGMHSRTQPMGHGSVPHRAMNHAFNGFAAFAWSMIGLADDVMQIDHRTLLSGKDKHICNLFGLSMFGLQVNNSIKVLDYLLTRKDIDTRRVGCTGESGGATQTYFLAALDDRIKVAAPTVMLSGHFQGGCVCENTPLLHLDYSTLDYAALIAPRPLFITGCTGDWTHHMRERELKSMKQVYGLYGEEELVDSFYQDESHNYDRRSREHVLAWMMRHLIDPSFAGRRIAESKKPVPTSRQLLVHDTPVPPVDNAITSQKALIDMWGDHHQRPDRENNIAHTLGLTMPAKDDLLVRNQTPAYAWADGTLASNRFTYGRFSEESGISCRFVLPHKGKKTLLILRAWKSNNAYNRFIRNPSKSIQRSIDRGYGVVIPLLFGQQSPDIVKAYRDQIEESYIATSYNRTTHQHQASDILTTAALIERDLGIPLKSVILVAERDIALTSLVGWSAIDGATKSGPIVSDMNGIDLASPAHWSRHAYFPLILRGGGIPDLARLWKGRRGDLSGLSAASRRLFPATFKSRLASRNLDQLITTATQ